MPPFSHPLFTPEAKDEMKILIILVALTAAQVSLGQTANDEMKRLKEHLGVPDQTAIQLATTSKITKSNDPLKVFIATGLDLGIRGNYLRWIEKWNKSGDSRKFGKVEVIDDLSQADFVLARYTLNEQARTESGSYVTPSTVWNPATNSTVTRPVARTYSYAMVPVFAYILSRTGTDFIIIYRYSDSTSLGEYRGSGESLWESFRDICLKRK